MYLPHISVIGLEHVIIEFHLFHINNDVEYEFSVTAYVIPINNSKVELQYTIFNLWLFWNLPNFILVFTQAFVSIANLLLKVKERNVLYITVLP